MKNQQKDISWYVFLQKEWPYISILIALCAYLFLFKLGSVSLWETDEPIYGEVAKEILKSGDWITLHFNYRAWFDKPPLYMWLTALWYYLSGWNEFTTRISSSLFGIGHVIAVYFFGRVMFNKKVGFFSAIFLATSLQFIIQSRLALVDVPLSFFITLSCLFFYLGTATSYKRYYFLLSSLFAGVATLTKGPVGVVIPLLIIGIYLFLTRNLKQLKKMSLPWMSLIFLLVASPWYIAEIIRHGRSFIDNFFLLRTVARFTTPFEGHTGPVYYYFGVLFLGFFPWSSFLPFSFFHLLKKKEKIERKKSFLIISWFCVIFIFFSLAKSKLPGYILPLYPACALAVGRLWDDFAERKVAGKKGIFISFGIFFLLLIVFALALLLVAKPSFPQEYSLFSGYLFLMVFGLFAAGIFSFIALFTRKRAFLSPAGLVAGMCFLVWVLTIYILPLTESFKPTKFLAKQITSVIQPGERIGNYPARNEDFMSFDCSLIYYCDHPVVGINSEKDLKAFLASKERVYCVMSVEAYQKVKKRLEGTPVYILSRRDGKILLSNREK